MPGGEDAARRFKRASALPSLPLGMHRTRSRDGVEGPDAAADRPAADFLCRDLDEMRARKSELGLPQSTPRANDRRRRLRLRVGKPWSEVDIQDLTEQVKRNATLGEASVFLRRVGDEFGEKAARAKSAASPGICGSKRITGR